MSAAHGGGSVVSQNLYNVVGGKQPTRKLTREQENAKKKQIKPRHMQLAIRNDEELNKLLCSTQISQGGVIPNATGTMAILWPKSKNAQK